MTGGAQVVVMEQDVMAYRALKSPSGKAQPMDRTIKDGETVVLGGTTLTARLTPGHTRGCTTWTTPVQEGGKTLNVGIACGGLQEDARLVGNKNYPEIADDFAKSIKIYKTLPVDVFLASHAWFYDPAGKYARLQKSANPNPYIDAAGYKAWVANMEKNWNSLMAEQSKAAAGQIICLGVGSWAVGSSSDSQLPTPNSQLPSPKQLFGLEPPRTSCYSRTGSWPRRAGPPRPPHEAARFPSHSAITSWSPSSTHSSAAAGSREVAATRYANGWQFWPSSSCGA